MRNHPTSAEVYERVREKHPSISRATVYRNLAVLAEGGDIVRVKVLDVNTEAKRISLSIREVLEDEALENVPDDEYAIGDDLPEVDA